MINYDKELIKVLKQAELEAINLKHNYIGTEHFILGILNTNNSIKDILNKNNLKYLSCKKEIIKIVKKDNKINIPIYTPLLKRILKNSVNNNKLNLKNTFLYFLEEGEGIGYTLLNSFNIDIKKVYLEIKNYNKEFNYGINLNKQNNNLIINREKELNEIIEILCKKNKNNPLLIGEAGVGKTALVEYLAYKIENNNVPDKLKNKNIISINMSSLVSGTKYRGEFEEKLNNLIKSVENTNVILFIDEIHTIIGAGGAEGAIDASNILKPYLARNNISCIGATTINEYNNSIKNDKALNRRFETVLINEPNYNDTLYILKKIKKQYEKYHNVKITNNQIKLIVDLANKNIKNKCEPDRSINILDTICTKTKLNNTININNDIKNIINQKERFLKNKEYNKAIQLDLNLVEIKTKPIKVKDSTIFEYFNISNKNFGFKV